MEEEAEVEGVGVARVGVEEEEGVELEAGVEAAAVEAVLRASAWLWRWPRYPRVEARARSSHRCDSSAGRSSRQTR